MFAQRLEGEFSNQLFHPGVNFCIRQLFLCDVGDHQGNVFLVWLELVVKCLFV